MVSVWELEPVEVLEWVLELAQARVLALGSVLELAPAPAPAPEPALVVQWQ
ncbi:hypothetical protein GCM10023116_49000 [Kistimonas scapharcae]|uniref:Uncharacterized protein n=1 Tax=Kistimonas scapharcae TaxID=1036133 RepID=A0ABP8V9P1_9GAMM